MRDGDQLTARERWSQAVEAGTRNPAIYRELARMEMSNLFSQFDVYFRVPEENVTRLRSYLSQSIEFNPEQSDAYEMLAWVEAFAEKPSIKKLNLAQRAAANLTRKERMLLALAFARMRLDKTDEALEMLAVLERMDPEPWEIYGIEAIRAFIEKRPIRTDNLRPTKPVNRVPSITKPGD